MNTMYRASFSNEQQAIDFANALIGGGIIQHQQGVWMVWQLS